MENNHTCHHLCGELIEDAGSRYSSRTLCEPQPNLRCGHQHDAVKRLIFVASSVRTFALTSVFLCVKYDAVHDKTTEVSVSLLFAPFVGVLLDVDWVFLKRRDVWRCLPPAWIYCKLSLP